MKCVICSEENQDGVEFCGGCGADLKSKPDISQSNQSSQQAPAQQPTASSSSAQTFPQSSGATSLPSKAKFTIKRKGAITAESFEIAGDSVIIGRYSPDTGPVDIELSNIEEAGYISRKHAKIYCKDNQWYIEDLGSTNGVFVNRGARITTATPIKDNDEIALGNLIFIFNTTTK